MQTKEYILPNGKKAVFEYDITGVGKITLECMDELMSMIADRPQGEWMHDDSSPIAYRCTACNTLQHWSVIQNGRYRFCPSCGARMKGADDDL